LSKLASSSFDFKPLYAAIAKEGFHSFRVFPIEKVDGNFLDFEGCFALNLFKVVCLSIGKKMDECFAHFHSKRLQPRRQVKQ
jgi:hypothetical protein